MAAQPQLVPDCPHLSDAERRKLERGLSEFVNRADGNGELILYFCQGAIRRIELKRTLS